MRRLNVGLAVTVSFFILSAFSKTYADDWDNFYAKYGKKVFVATWSQQTFKKDGSVQPKQDREFGYGMASADSVRRIYRNTNATTGEARAPGDYVIYKGQPKSGGDKTNPTYFETVEIEKNSIVNYFWKHGYEQAEMRITVNANSCTARWMNEDFTNTTTDHIVRSAISCKIVE